MRQDILGVSQLLKEMKETINQNERLSNVALIGEVSNFSAHRSGHFYFNLKDDASRISCVMFKSSAAKILFEPKAGDKVILVGHVSVFEASGSVQFYASKMVLDGLGVLHQEYEKLKLSYQEKGYFDEKRKRSIKQYPQSIALITGEGSAAYADMQKTIAQRWPGVKVHVLYSLVQGPQAKFGLVNQIQQAQNLNVDTIVLARGGGSIEDLWAFNEPEVVEAIVACSIPVVTGIGHESDTTLSDLAADLRAATPTAAIVATLPSQTEVHQRIRGYMNQYYLAVRRNLRTQQARYQHTLEWSVLLQPQRMIDKRAMLLDYYKQSLMQGLKRFDQVKVQVQHFELDQQFKLLNKIELNKTAVQFNHDQTLDQMHAKVANNEQLLNHYRTQQNQLLRHEVFKLREVHKTFDKTHQELLKYGVGQVELKQKAFTDIMKVLHTLSPIAIMAKGFALTYHDETLIKTIEDVTVEDTLTIRYKDGKVIAKVTGKESK